jgi:NAD(P)-dependent dehydrogenase (short-subunit alcohol dehydrogenase family)
VNHQSIVITGSTSGIGLGLADCFLAVGCKVMLSGRDPSKLDSAYQQLAQKHGADRVSRHLCNVADYGQLEGLWDAAAAQFGSIDIWINNAGIGHGETDFADFGVDQVKTIVEINVTGAIWGSMVALKGMLRQGSGAIYNMEGLGSDGRVVKGMAIYATTKAAISYLTKSLAVETRGTPVLTGAIRPGMVVTKLITDQFKDDPEGWRRNEKIFNILSDRVEVVTPWLAQKILRNRKHGAVISWLSSFKIMLRFMAAPFHKRNVYY